MANTVNLQGTINWAAPFINYQPVTIGGVEPALSCANIVLQTILGPPFCWRFNRGTAAFTCSNTNPPTVDYAQAAADFGFIEKAWVKLVDSSDLKELTIRTALSSTVDAGRPEYISALLDDNQGNITFRLNPGPDAAYPVSVLYQRKAALMTSLASNWYPIPDEYSYIYNWGFLSIIAILIGDNRFPIYNQRFVSHLLGAQDGLDDMQRNIFLGNWDIVTKQIQRAAEKAKQGIAARQL